MSRPYAHGSGTTEDPLRYDVTNEFLRDLSKGHWETGMIDAAVEEIRRLRKENLRLRHAVEEGTEALERATERLEQLRHAAEQASLILFACNGPREAYRAKETLDVALEL